jgi:DNA polymerase-2
MAVWFIDNDGNSLLLHDRFSPSFYVRGPQEELREVCQLLRKVRAPVDLARTERKDLFLDREIEVLQVSVHVPAVFQRTFRQVTGFRPKLTYYDADIPLPQRYVLERQVFPLAYCAIDEGEGCIRDIKALDSPWETDYRLPPFRVVSMRLDGELRNPARGHRGNLLVEVDGREYSFKRERSRELVLGIRHILEHHDPDILVSAYGDNYILPHKRAHSYFSYGRVMYIGEQHLLSGRWHLDRQNAFLANDYGLDGTLEIARISGLPVQTVNRVSTGTGISAMQVATALRRGVLVPWQKRQPESLKTGVDLLTADKGGLVYTPIVGLHEHVAELDFTAMYPSIMVHFNVSPETVGTNCCEGENIPELGTHICRHRQGLVPETLAPLLEKRNRYKALIRQLPEGDPKKEAFRRRYSAHKWLLVTCFGYLGYKNARFGRIEAHEAVNAYGREVLLRAKEIVEARGFRVLHLYVDGLWIHKPGTHERPDYEGLLEEIQRETELLISLEGVYRWLAFLPSRVEPRVAVANRYFGAYEDGTVKVRGIEYRRRDTPKFIKETQMEMITILSGGKDAAGFRAAVPTAIAYAQDRLRDLRNGEAPLNELLVTHRLTRQLEEYSVRTVAVRAATQLTAEGFELSPGQSMHFVYVPGPEKVRAWELIDDPIPYDREIYTDLFIRAIESLLAPVDVDRHMLDTWMIGNAGYWGPPGTLPPIGIDGGAPLLARTRYRQRRNRYETLPRPIPIQIEAPVYAGRELVRA